MRGAEWTMDTAITGGTKQRPAFSRYQKFVIAILAFLQFTIILDFMIISPLGAMMMPTLHITPQQFGLAVSSYAFSAGVSGLLAAGFADRFDRKRLLLFFYAGFMLGTLLCALATTYPLLLAARIVTGLFGGVIGSVVLAIATDLFPAGDARPGDGLHPDAPLPPARCWACPPGFISPTTGTGMRRSWPSSPSRCRRAW